MTRVNYPTLLLNLFVFVGVQIILNQRIVLFDTALAQIYIGFLLLLPRTIPQSYQLVIAFVIGLIVDIFSNTPGMNACSSLFAVLLKDFWMNKIDDESLDWPSVTVYRFTLIAFLYYLFPLVFIHHLILFTIENGGFHLFHLLSLKVVSSTLLTGVLIVLIQFLIISNRNDRSI